MTSPFDDLASFCRKLADVDIKRLIVGSVAAMHFDEPRTTIDIDLVVKAGPANAERIAGAFRDERYYVPPAEVIRRELGRSAGTFKILDSTTGLKADCYPIKRDELGVYELAHALPGTLGDSDVFFAPAAAIIAMKLRYHAISGQDKHLRDIRSMLATSPEATDMDFLDAWTQKQDLWDIWQACRRRGVIADSRVQRQCPCRYSQP